MHTMSETRAPHPAVVARHPYDGRAAAEEYLILSAQGAPQWTADPGAATAFASMREAVRAALRLSGAVRAFGLPLSSELSAHPAH